MAIAASPTPPEGYYIPPKGIFDFVPVKGKPVLFWHEGDWKQWEGKDLTDAQSRKNFIFAVPSQPSISNEDYSSSIEVPEAIPDEIQMMADQINNSSNKDKSSPEPEIPNRVPTPEQYEVQNIIVALHAATTEKLNRFTDTLGIFTPMECFMIGQIVSALRRV